MRILDFLLSVAGRPGRSPARQLFTLVAASVKVLISKRTRENAVKAALRRGPQNLDAPWCCIRARRDWRETRPGVDVALTFDTYVVASCERAKCAAG